MGQRQQRVRKAVDKIVDNAVEQAIKEQDVTTAKGFFHNMMSVDEARVSVLMICLLLSLLFGGYAYIVHGDVSQVWASLIETFAYCVTGINMLAALTPAKGSKAAQLLGTVLGGAQDEPVGTAPGQAPATSTVSATTTAKTPVK